MFGRGREKLYKQGALTEGVIVHRSDTSAGINYHVTVRVKLPDGTAPEFKKWLDWHDVGQLRVGSVVPVRYDPSDHSKVGLDLPALEELHAQAGAAGRAQVDAQFARLGDPGSAADLAPGVQGLAGMGNPGDLKAQLLQMAAENPGSVVNLSSGSPGQPGSDPVDRLARLADLKEQGALSEAERAASAAALIGRVAAIANPFRSAIPEAGPQATHGRPPSEAPGRRTRGKGLAKADRTRTQPRSHTARTGARAQ